MDRERATHDAGALELRDLVLGDLPQTEPAACRRDQRVPRGCGWKPSGEEELLLRGDEIRSVEFEQPLTPRDVHARLVRIELLHPPCDPRVHNALRSFVRDGGGHRADGSLQRRLPGDSERDAREGGLLLAHPDRRARRGHTCHVARLRSFPFHRSIAPTVLSSIRRSARRQGEKPPDQHLLLHRYHSSPRSASRAARRAP